MQRPNHTETPKQSGPCRYRRHLKGAQLSIYEFALALPKAAKSKDLLFFAGIARVCLETGYARATATAALSDLCRAGWLIALGGNTDAAKAGGHFQPNTYRVIEHGQWAALHPGECERIARDRENPSRENTATEETGEPVAGKSVNPVAEKPPHKVVLESVEGGSSTEPAVLYSWPDNVMSCIEFPELDDRMRELDCDFAAELFDILVWLSDEEGRFSWDLSAVQSEIRGAWGAVLTQAEAEEYLKMLREVGMIDISRDGQTEVVQVSPFPGWRCHRRLSILRWQVELGEHIGPCPITWEVVWDRLVGNGENAGLADIPAPDQARVGECSAKEAEAQ